MYLEISMSSFGRNFTKLQSRLEPVKHEDGGGGVHVCVCVGGGGGGVCLHAEDL